MEERRPYRSFVSYMDRSREYYAAQGYRQPYAWAYHREVPFAKLRKRLPECRIGLVTTAGRMEVEGASKTWPIHKEPYAGSTHPAPSRLFTADLFWDKNATHTDDVESFLPVKRMGEFAAEHRIGSLSPRFYGSPTDYSQNRATQRTAPKILEWCREDGVDAVLLSAL